MPTQESTTKPGRPLDEGRHVGRTRGARRARQPEPLEPPGLHELLGARHGRAGERDLPADGVRNRLPAAFVGHMDEARARALAQHLAGHVRAAAGAGRSIGESSGLGAGQFDQLAQVLRRHRRVGDHEDTRVAKFGDRREIAQHIETRLCVDVRVDDDGAVIAEQQRVAVRRALGDQFRADVAGRARPVFDDHRLAETRAELVGDRARAVVGNAARGERNHDAHCLCRPLRVGRRETASDDEADRKAQSTFQVHGVSSSAQRYRGIVPAARRGYCLVIPAGEPVFSAPSAVIQRGYEPLLQSRVEPFTYSGDALPSHRIAWATSSGRAARAE